MNHPLRPEQVIPKDLAAAVTSQPYWFVIGGHAVRCFAPYRPTRDVDFGVGNARDQENMVKKLKRSGTVEVSEKSAGTLHLKWNGLDVSIFVLDTLLPYAEDKRLTVEGILATKLHALLDRGVRRDFFDLYVILEEQRLGIAECLSAVRTVYSGKVPDALLLRALTYFDDAERETPIPGEGKGDWSAVKDYFLTRVGNLMLPPSRKLRVQSNRVDVNEKK